MANQLAANPMKIDTPGPGVLFSSNMKLRHIEFTGYAATSDKAIVTDRYGNIIAELSATTDLQEVRTGNVGWVYGLIVPTLTSGIVLVYFE